MECFVDPSENGTGFEVRGLLGLVIGTTDSEAHAHAMAAEGTLRQEAGSLEADLDLTDVPVPTKEEEAQIPRARSYSELSAAPKT